MRQPTAMQLDLLRLIAARTAEAGIPPSLRELARGIGASRYAVLGRLHWLARKGLVTWRPKACRTLQLTPAGKLWVAEQYAITGPDGSVSIHSRSAMMGQHVRRSTSGRGEGAVAAAAAMRESPNTTPTGGETSGVVPVAAGAHLSVGFSDVDPEAIC